MTNVMSGFISTANELPPVLVLAHGGPTGSTTADLNMLIQYPVSSFHLLFSSSFSSLFSSFSSLANEALLSFS